MPTRRPPGIKTTTDLQRRHKKAVSRAKRKAQSRRDKAAHAAKKLNTTPMVK